MPEVYFKGGHLKMAHQLTGKTSIVTGASSGIGAAIAKELVKSNSNVVIAARNENKLAEIAAKIEPQEKIHYIKTDMTKQEDVLNLVEQTKEKFGGVDILVNNAGMMGSSSILKGAISNWDQMIDLNIKGVLYGINSVLPDMLKKESGHIVNIASVFGHEVLERSTVYSATKFAVRAISTGLEKELAQTGVRVSNISPGMVETELSSQSPFDNNGKKLEPADVARGVLYAVTQPDYVNVNEITIRTIWE